MNDTMKEASSERSENDHHQTFRENANRSPENLLTTKEVKIIASTSKMNDTESSEYSENYNPEEEQPLREKVTRSPDNLKAATKELKKASLMNGPVKNASSECSNNCQPQNATPSDNPTTFNLTSTCRIPFQHRNTSQPFSKQTPQETKNWVFQVCRQIIDDMNRYGVCVIDNLLGEARGSAILKEVQKMYSTGAFTDGQLVKGAGNSEGPSASQLIRGDKITWVDGEEPHCRNIAVLMKLLDSLVIGAKSKMNSGKLGSYNILTRSKAMVACYPGSGSHYVKHVDNPNDDGRCVTAIYYLNKDWSSRDSGGLLRIFPEGWSHQVADIDPLFDRVIFFWSDRRNPHEVQPAFKTRYAITLWYFDSNAKKATIKSEESS